jgi:hypothetical protein
MALSIRIKAGRFRCRIKADRLRCRSSIQKVLFYSVGVMVAHPLP